MEFDEKLPSQLQDALDKGLLNRLPITFLPVTRQQLREWEYLFPYERQSILHLLLYLASLSEAQSAALFQEVVQLEEKMGVRNWQFTTNEQTILNASLLARSPYYQDWRKAVQKVFDEAEQNAAAEKSSDGNAHRLILLVLPQPLPLDASKIWQRWQGLGHPIRLDLSQVDETLTPSETLLTAAAPTAPTAAPLWKIVSRRSNASSSDSWILDSGSALVDCALKQQSPSPVSYTHLRAHE